MEDVEVLYIMEKYNILTAYIHCIQEHVYGLPLSVIGSLNGPVPLTLTAAT